MVMPVLQKHCADMKADVEVPRWRMGEEGIRKAKEEMRKVDDRMGKAEEE
jgi:hypothetical protein